MRSGEMVTSARTIRQYCSVCKATLDMSVVDTVQDHEVTWLKCPRCNGILPHMIAGEDEPLAATTTATPPAEPTPGEFSETDRSAAQDYDSAGIYEVGQVLYHRSINKFARVVEKTVLAGQRAAIRGRVEDGAEMTLRAHV